MVNDPHVSQILALWTSCTQRLCQADEHKANRCTGKDILSYVLSSDYCINQSSSQITFSI